MVAYAQGLDKVSGMEGAKVHGGLLTLGYLLARLKLRGRLHVLPKDTVLKAVDTVVNALLEVRDQAVLDAAIQSFSEICVFAVVEGEYFRDTHSRILTRLSELGKKGKEKAILAIGYFSIVFPSSSSIVDGLLEALFAFHENRQVEVNFTTGEAIACVAGGWHCKAIRGKVDLAGYEDAKILDVIDKERLGKVVGMVIGKMSDTKPSLRKAVCMWMLSLLEFFGEAKGVK
jgi:proteasome component ECM29